MRLRHGDHPAFGGLASSRKHSADFHRMMSIIVDHAGARDFPDPGEAPPHTSEASKPGADRVVLAPQLYRDSYGGECVLHVVTARHRQRDICNHPALTVPLGMDNIEQVTPACLYPSRPDVLGAPIGLR